MIKMMAFMTAATLTVGVAARPAAGQSVSATYRFVDIGAGAEYGDSPMPGVVPGMRIAAGVMNERRGLQFEVAVSGSHVENSGPFRYQFTFPDTQYWRLGHFYEDSGRTKTRSVSATALYAHRLLSSGPVHATFLVGGGLAPSFSQTTFVTKEVRPDGSLVVVHTDEFPGSTRHLVAALGVDADIRLSRHVSIVPSLRVLVFPIEMFDEAVDNSGSGQRVLVAPQAALRWRF